MRKCLLSLLILAVPAMVFGQTIEVPDKVQVDGPGYVIIRSTKIDADDVRWYSIGKPEIQILPPDVFKPPVGVFVGQAPATGTYKIGVITAKAIKFGDSYKAVMGVPQIITITVGAPGPIPPDPPGPGPGPGPDPDPFKGGLDKADYGTNPFKVGGGLRCLIVYESADLSKYPAAQEAILFDKSIRDYLSAHCTQGDKVKDWRIWDQNVDVKDEAPLWQKVMARPRKSVPWIIVGNGKSGFEGPLPADVPSTLKLLQKYGGP